MNILEPILVIDVNVIIHLEKVNLLDVLIKDKNIRIVDVVLYDEYLYKKNVITGKVEKISQLSLNEVQVFEAKQKYKENSRNSFYDYCSYIAARDNKYDLLTGDWKLKKYVKDDILVHGSIWYVQNLRKKGIIDDDKLKEIYEIWLNDPMVYIKEELLVELLMELN